MEKINKKQGKKKEYKGYREDIMIGDKNITSVSIIHTDSQTTINIINKIKDYHTSLDEREKQIARLDPEASRFLKSKQRWQYKALIMKMERLKLITGSEVIIQKLNHIA